MKALLITTLLIAFAFLNGIAARAENLRPCPELSLVKFMAGGKEAASQLIGAGGACDDFGGNLAYSPKHQRFVYVNFNIEGSIDLDKIDAAYELAPATGPVHNWIAKVQIAIVDKDWIKRVYLDDREAILNFGGDTFFVSEKVLNESRFESVVADFYSSAK